MRKSLLDNAGSVFVISAIIMKKEENDVKTQNAVIYIEAEWSNKPKNLKKLVEKLAPIYKRAELDELEVVKVYFEKPKYRTAYKRMMNFLPNHPEIETVMFFDGDDVIRNSDNLVNILNLEKSTYLTNENTAKVITVPAKLHNLKLFESKTKNGTR